MDPKPDLGRAVVELRASRRGRDQPIEGPGGAAARRRGGGRRGRCGVAARALDGGAELVGAIAERRLRGARRDHVGPPAMDLHADLDLALALALALALGLVGGRGWGGERGRRAAVGIRIQ